MPPRARGRAESRSPARAAGAKVAPRERSLARSTSRSRMSTSRVSRTTRPSSTSQSRPKPKSTKSSVSKPAEPLASKPTRTKAAAVKKDLPKPVSRSSRARVASPARGRPRTRSMSRARAVEKEHEDEGQGEEEETEEKSEPVKIAPRTRRRGEASPARASSSRLAKASETNAPKEHEDELLARHPVLAPPSPAATLQRSASLSPVRPSSVSSFPPVSPAALPEPAKGSNGLSTAGVISFYFATSLFVVFVNKALLTATSPSSAMFLTWIQILGAAILAVVAGYLASVSGSSALAQLFPRFRFSLPLQLHALPISLAFTALLLANNLCLAYVHISFYQVARAWTVVFNIILAFLLFGVRPSAREVLCCVIVALGYAVACDSVLPSLASELSGVVSACVKPAVAAALPEAASQWLAMSPTKNSVCFISAPMWGILYGVLGSLLLSLYALMIKRTLAALPVPDGVLAGAVNINASLMLALLLPWFGTGPVPALTDASFWAGVAAVTAAGYLLNTATYLQIKHTSALTHNVSGTAKASVQSVLGWLRYRNPVSLATAAGTAATILGCALYAYVRGQAPRPVSTSTEAEGEAKGVNKVAPFEGTTLPMPKWAQYVAQTMRRFITSPPPL